jgi:hypothetical protein
MTSARVPTIWTRRLQWITRGHLTGPDSGGDRQPSGRVPHCRRDLLGGQHDRLAVTSMPRRIPRRAWTPTDPAGGKPRDGVWEIVTLSAVSSRWLVSGYVV